MTKITNQSINQSINQSKWPEKNNKSINQSINRSNELSVKQKIPRKNQNTCSPPSGFPPRPLYRRTADTENGESPRNGAAATADEKSTRVKSCVRSFLELRSKSFWLRLSPLIPSMAAWANSVMPLMSFRNRLVAGRRRSRSCASFRNFISSGSLASVRLPSFCRAVFWPSTAIKESFQL